MSRALSAVSLAAMEKGESAETLIVLITVTPSGSVESHRFSSMYKELLDETPDGEIYGVVSRGNEFVFAGFRARLPNDTDASPTGVLEMPYSDEGAILLRSLGEAPAVLIEVVRYSDPDIVEATYRRFYISACNGSRDTLSIQLARKNFDTEPWPAQTYTPSNTPGVF